ncbi:MAG: 30S ribosomal protein S4 [Candidatus Bathyarchaeia archaeon]|jgi:small subunit ribosomal protein S4|nr:30S ribosomal protein S4 [Candidatus Bathyarchaeota archaeon A05DMB-4]MDH7594600.1 30S ribosomal protein S4 [Candidatus Bathyarchaeota archaeon]
MGDPKKQSKKYETPRFPWRTDTLQAELKLLGEYGLRNKHELWRHRTMLSRFRGIARSLLGMPQEQREVLEKQLLTRLNRLGILPETAVLDDVLDLAIENILERRLQTLVHRKGLAKSIHQARQLIIHGHIAIDKKRVRAPSYLVLKDEEAKITFSPTSALANPEHPIHQIAVAETKHAPQPKRKTGGRPEEAEE